MMILTFLVGSILALVGRVGDDTMSLVSYILSAENFESEDPLLLEKLDDAKKYLNICLHGNGSLENEFDLGDSLNAIEDIDDVLMGLEDVTQQFIDIKENLPSFKTFREQIKDRTDYLSSKFGLLGVNDTESNIIFGIILPLFNKEIKAIGKNESWDIDGDKTKICIQGKTDNFTEGEYKLHPATCKPRDREYVEISSKSNIKDYMKLFLK